MVIQFENIEWKIEFKQIAKDLQEIWLHDTKSGDFLSYEELPEAIRQVIFEVIYA